MAASIPSCSFLIPVRDAAATLGRAIESCLAQTVADVEVVVVDDGSTDGSQALAHAASERDGRVQVLACPARGLAAALNAGLALCRAPFVARLDADDVAAEDRLAEQLPLLRDEPRLAVVDGQVRFFRAGEAVPEGMRRYGEWVNAVLAPADFDRALLVESPIVHPAATLRSAAVAEVGGYRDGDFPEDYDLWLRLDLAGWRFRKVARECVRMLDRPGRLTRTDPRYRPEAFRALAQEWLAVRVFDRPRAVVLWGGGRTGRPWLRWLRSIGSPPIAVVDVDPRKIGRERQGTPVVAPEQLAEIEAEVCLVAVAARGARQLIRAELGRRRGDWVEGKDWWNVI